MSIVSGSTKPIARPPVSLAGRRIRAVLITVIASAAMAAAAVWTEQRLANRSTLTGVTLTTTLVILIALGIRRRLPGIELGSMSAWTQTHLYTGIFSAVVYVLHVPAIVAGGVLEFFLSATFLIVSTSGFYGVYASRSYPRRIRLAGGQDGDRETFLADAKSVYDAIPIGPAGDVLRQQYLNQHRSYFENPRSWWFAFYPTKNRRERMLADLAALDRYLDPPTRESSAAIAHLIKGRDAVDFSAALRWRMRVWVAVHASLSVSLLCATLIHIALVWMHRS